MKDRDQGPTKGDLHSAPAQVVERGIPAKSLLWMSTLHITLVLLFIQVFDYRPVFDSLRYLQVADEFSQMRFPGADPALNCNTAPGYPLFLAMLSPITGHNTIAIAVFQALLFVIGLRSFINALVLTGTLDRRQATGCLLIPLFIPDIIHINGWVLTESLTTSLLLIFMAGAVRAPASRSASAGWVIAGSLLVLTKFEYLVVVFMAGGYIALSPRRARIVPLITVLLTVLCLNAWRNSTMYGRPNPFSFGSGTVIYGGNNLNGDGSWHLPSTSTGYLPPHAVNDFERIAALPAGVGCPEQDRFFKDLAIEAWKEDPWQQLRTIPLKFLKLWMLPADLDIYTHASQHASGLQLGTLFNTTLWPMPGIIRHAAELLAHWIVLACLLFGLAQRMRQSALHGNELLMLAIAGILSLLYAVPFYGLGRFHVPALALLSCFMAGPVLTFATWALRRTTGPDRST